MKNSAKKPKPKTSSKAKAVNKINKEVCEANVMDTKNNTNSSEYSSSNSDILETFNLELKWCLQQLELGQTAKDTKNTKKVEELNKCHRILSNPKHPMIKKRQAMRSYFGDYREKMAKDEETFKYSSAKLNDEVKAPFASLFLKKSSNTDINNKSNLDELSINNSFKFNFHVDLE